MARAIFRAMRRSFIWFSLLWLSGFPGPLSAKDLAAYRIGDAAEEDIVTPIRLVVINPETSAALKQKEAERSPIFFRFYPGLAAGVANDFRAAFASTRSNFLRAVENAFGRQRLDDAALAAPEFQRLVASFQAQSKSLPVSTSLAALWASGDSGQSLQVACLARLGEAMAHPIRAESDPAGFRLGSQLRLLVVTSLDDAPTLELAGRRSVTVPLTNVFTLSRARAELERSVPAEAQALAPFAASLLKPNCVLDTGLTRQSQTQRTETIYAADRYDAGQVICRRGQVIDPKIMAALAQLRAQPVVSQLPQPVRKPQSLAGPLSAPARQMPERNGWWLAGLAGVVVILMLGLWRLTRRPRRASLVPARIATDDALPMVAPGSSWEQRALAAERRAQKAHAVIRAGLLPQLGQLLKTKLVRGLISQRSDLLDAQHKAAAEMADLERRLDELHAPLQERLRAYEKRIEELEKALAAKGEENRELLKAKIQMAKRQLEAQRTKNRVEFN